MHLSPLIRFGTSTWTYEGWQGQVYKKQYAKTKLVQECLGEYCQYQYNGEPLFRTVGNDSTFYRPPMANQLLQYLNQIPEDLEMCCKVWKSSPFLASPATRHWSYMPSLAEQNQGMEHFTGPFTVLRLLTV